MRASSGCTVSGKHLMCQVVTLCLHTPTSPWPSKARHPSQTWLNAGTTAPPLARYSAMFEPMSYCFVLLQKYEPDIQQTGYINPMLSQFWSNVCDAGPTLRHYGVDASWLYCRREPEEGGVCTFCAAERLFLLTVAAFRLQWWALAWWMSLRFTGMLGPRPNTLYINSAHQAPCSRQYCVLANLFENLMRTSGSIEVIFSL